MTKTLPYQDCHHGIANFLSGCYEQAHRYYHNAAHIDRMFRALTTIPSHYLAEGNLVLIQWAIFFHDCVYCKGRKASEHSNEMASSHLASDLLRTAGMSSADVGDITAIIQATDYERFPIGSTNYRHNGPGGETLDYLRDLIRDLDLAVFADEWDDIMRRNDAVFHESGLEQREFDIKYLEFLRNIRFPMFVTPEMEHLNTPASYNIVKQIKWLDETLNKKKS